MFSTRIVTTTSGYVTTLLTGSRVGYRAALTKAWTTKSQRRAERKRRRIAPEGGHTSGVQLPTRDVSSRCCVAAAWALVCMTKRLSDDGSWRGPVCRCELCRSEATTCLMGLLRETEKKKTCAQLKSLLCLDYRLLVL